MNRCEVAEFEKTHVADAARLFAAGYREARDAQSLLPARFEDSEVTAPRIAELAGRRPGVAAIEDRALLGYLLGGVIPSWRGDRTAFVPFWAHSVAGEQRGRTMEDMYAALADKWTEDGCTTHLITVLTHDRQVVDAMFKVGHGMAVYDAMRDLGGVEGPLADVEVRRAGPGDREVFHGLRMGLVDYLAGPPVYLVTGEDKPEEYYNDWLGNPTRSVWLAYHQDEPVGYIQACTLDESVLVTDEKTAWIQGAFTKPHQRGQGIAATLLRRCIEWVREQGCGRCAVDFEGENVLGRRFWLKHFEPVDLSLVRHLDRRVAG